MTPAGGQVQGEDVGPGDRAWSAGDWSRGTRAMLQQGAGVQGRMEKRCGNG